MKQAIAHLATPDGPTRTLVAVAYLHVVDPPVTTGKVNDLLGHVSRRAVERNVQILADSGLLEIHAGRPRTLTPAVRLVAWADPSLPTSSAVSWPAVRRAAQRAVGCRHPLTSRWGQLCLDCGEPLDTGIPTAVPSTTV